MSRSAWGSFGWAMLGRAMAEVFASAPPPVLCLICEIDHFILNAAMFRHRYPQLIEGILVGWLWRMQECGGGRCTFAVEARMKRGGAGCHPRLHIIILEGVHGGR
jgi:hypothetical protein